MDKTSIAGTNPWLGVLLNYTDAVCDALPDDDREIRPEDPAGAFVFSALEQAMHIADQRWEFLKWLTGEDHTDRLFLKKYPGKQGTWEFRGAGREDVLYSLKSARSSMDELLEVLPAAAWNETTPELTRMHEKRMERARSEGIETADFEQQGPSTLGNMVLFMVAHETGHRAVLQHMLRMAGIAVVRFA